MCMPSTPARPDICSPRLVCSARSARQHETLNGAVNGFAGVRLVGDDCILYSYDRDADSASGTPENDDRFGLRLRSGALQMKSSDSCSPPGCEDCDGGVWWSMTDPASITVTALAFELDAHQHELPGGNTVTARSVRYVLEGALTEDPAVTATIAGAADLRNDEIE
jgi:hypothetical protein